MKFRNLLLLIPLALPVPVLAKAPPQTLQQNAVASGHFLATQAGQEILAKGGNAFDAAIAVSATLSVVEPISSGIGGGGLFLLRQAKTGRDVMIDARETAPHSATPDKFLDAAGELDRDKSVNGPMSAGIPGLPAALVHLAKNYGRLPLSQSLAPAIRIARNGFEIYPRLESGYSQRAEVMARYAGSRKTFLADGDPPQTGEVLKQEDLARTLELIAAKGFDGFYRGETAQEMLGDVAKYGGNWNAEDLTGYKVVERVPMIIDYNGWRITSAPPPSSGGVAIAEMLNILQSWDLQAMPPVLRTHLITEAMRRAYRDRSLYLGDPDFISIPLQRLLSKDYAAGLRASINPSKATPSSLLPGSLAPGEDDETTHFSIIDSAGNRVSATQTVNLTYGSGMIVDGGGFLLNNEMDDFALKAGTPNAFGVMGYAANLVAPGKRMLSSMTPSFMDNPEKTVVLGTPGGSRIITMVLLGILAADAGMDAQAITALPRFHHQYLPDKLYAEPGAFDEQLIQELSKLGHSVEVSKSPWGNMQTVIWNKKSNTLSAGSDPRNAVGLGMVVDVSKVKP
jgi:gamma-glutamyltranspeptidase / glutathione hydrolase